MEKRNPIQQSHKIESKQSPQERQEVKAKNIERPSTSETTQDRQDLILAAENRALSRDIAAYGNEESETKKKLLEGIAISSVDWAWKKSGLRKSLTEQVMDQTEQTYETDTTRHEAKAKKLVVIELLRNRPAEMDFLMMQSNRPVAEIRDELERLAQKSIESLSARLNQQVLNRQANAHKAAQQKANPEPPQATSFISRITGWLK